MKKVLLIAAVAAFAMTSCKKDYTCECTVSASSGGITISGTTDYTIKDTKKKAKDACTDKESSAPAGSTSSCAIK